MQCEHREKEARIEWEEACKQMSEDVTVKYIMFPYIYIYNPVYACVCVCHVCDVCVND